MHPPWSVVGVRSGFQTKMSPTFRKTGSSLFWPKLPLNFFTIPRPSGPPPPAPPPGHGPRKPQKVQRRIQKSSECRKKGPGRSLKAGFEPVHPPSSIAGVKSVSDGFIFVIIILSFFSSSHLYTRRHKHVPPPPSPPVQ
jgi:hypothetical protein